MSGCWLGECHFPVSNAWRAAKAAGESRSVRARSAGKEVKWDGEQAKSEERASSKWQRFEEVTEGSVPEKGLEEEPPWAGE